MKLSLLESFIWLWVLHISEPFIHYNVIKFQTSKIT